MIHMQLKLHDNLLALGGWITGSIHNSCTGRFVGIGHCSHMHSCLGKPVGSENRSYQLNLNKKKVHIYGRYITFRLVRVGERERERDEAGGKTPLGRTTDLAISSISICILARIRLSILRVVVWNIACIHSAIRCRRVW